MHKSTKLTPKTRSIVYREWCKSKGSFRSLGLRYHVDKNVIKKVIIMGRLGDFSIHDSTNRRYRTIEYGLRRLSRTEERLKKRDARRHGIWTDKDAPGELVHLDTKKLPYLKGEKKERAFARQILFVAIDDATRFLFADILPDKTGDSAALFFETCSLRFPFPVQCHYSDNGSEFKGNETHPVATLCSLLGVKQKFTQPRHPWTNGKAERVIRTLMEEWLTFEESTTHEERRRSLYRYVDRYNHQRPHRSLEGKTPVEVLTKLLESGDNA